MGRYQVIPSTETTARQNRKPQTRFSHKIGFCVSYRIGRVADYQQGRAEEQYTELLTLYESRLMQIYAKSIKITGND
jgi:hypothetical protein